MNEVKKYQVSLELLQEIVSILQELPAKNVLGTINKISLLVKSEDEKPKGKEDGHPSKSN